MAELVAILRGVQPEEALPMMKVLVKAGVRSIEIPLNSPSPLESIGLMSKNAPEGVTIGAGTVLSADDVRSVAKVGAQLIVAPNMDVEVIGTAKDLGLAVLPGVATPNEAFSALKAGADGLKLFPAFQIGPVGLAAMRAVLPDGVRVLAVGGVGSEDFEAWLASGASGFGIGSHIFKPEDTPETVGPRAEQMVKALDAACGAVL